MFFFFILRRSQEEHYDKEKKLYMCFVDIEKAFGKVVMARNRLGWIKFRKYGELLQVRR